MQDLAALGDADDRVLAAGDPDRAFGVEADAVRAEAVGEDPPVGQPAAGIDVVMVNGQVVWRSGRSTGARPGRVLRRATA